MMTVLEVKNFQRYQHYKDRNPPWIKLYTALLSDVAFVGLPEVSRYHLIALWIVASRSEGILPDDGRVLSRLIVADTAVDVDGLVSSGFLIRRQAAKHGAATPYRPAPLSLATCGQGAPETLYPENRGQNFNSNSSARETWLIRFTETDRTTVTGFLDGQPDHQSEVWSARINGYLKGMDMPSGKIATPAAIATAIRDLDGSELNPARFRRYVERAMVDAANPILAKPPRDTSNGKSLVERMAAAEAKHATR